MSSLSSVSRIESAHSVVDALPDLVLFIESSCHEGAALPDFLEGGSDENVSDLWEGDI